MFFQETRRVMENTPAYNYVCRVRDPEDDNNNRQGGGIAIGIAKSLTFRDVTTTVPQALQEALELVFVQIAHEQFELYALNVYLARYHKQKRLLKQLQDWIIELRCKKPTAIFLIAGDFNTAKQPIEHFHELSHEDGTEHPTFRRVVQGVTRQSRTDWVLCSHELHHETLYHWTAHSDHCVIECSMELPRSQPKATHIVLPKADVVLEMCKNAQEQSRTVQDFLKHLSAQARTRKHLKKIRVTLKQKQEQKHSLQEFAEQIDKQIRTTSSKQAFQLINRLSIVHPTRRDGGIMTCFMR